jgi:hypothetical protein
MTTGVVRLTRSNRCAVALGGSVTNAPTAATTQLARTIASRRASGDGETSSGTAAGREAFN